MKLLILIKYHNYNEIKYIKSIHETICKLYQIDLYFLVNDINIENNYKLDNNILYIKKEEKYLDTSLQKVILGLKYFENYDYTDIFIGDILTFINIPEILKCCNNSYEIYTNGNEYLISRIRYDLLVENIYNIQLIDKYLVKKLHYLNVYNKQNICKNYHLYYINDNCINTWNYLYNLIYHKNIFVYWGQGYNKMPELLKKIYDNNVLICKEYNLKINFIDDINVYDYIIPHSRFKSLEYNFKSDMIRFYILNKYGGFWFDTDILIIKNLNKIHEFMINQTNYDIIVDVEHLWEEGIDGIKLGSASLYFKKQSICSKHCLNYVNNKLNNISDLNWNDIGPWAIRDVYKNLKNRIKVNNYEITKNGCNFICWNENPGFFKDNWYMDETIAEQKAKKIYKNKDCFYVITWSIYKENDIKTDLIDFVFNDKKSVFSYFILENKYCNVPTVYIYKTYNFYNKYREPYFEECSVIEKYYFENIKSFNLTNNINDADIAFIPITPASYIYEKGINDFKKHYDEFINLIELDSTIPHFIIYPYTFYNQDYNNISFIDKRINILCFENEITNFEYGLNILDENPKENRVYNSITIPFHLNKINDYFNRCTGIKDVKFYKFEQKKIYLFCFVGMSANIGGEYDILYPDRVKRIKNYRENILNEFIKKYGKENVLVGSPDKDNAFDFYCQSKYALIFRGDCMTRVAFYQALMAGCVPIICNDCFLDYQNYNGFFFDLEKAVIRIPYCNELFNREKFNFINENNIWNIIDKYIQNDSLRLKNIEYIKNIVKFIDYNNIINKIKAPIYYSLQSIIKTKDLRKPFELVYFNLKNNELLGNILKKHNFKNNIVDVNNENIKLLNNIFNKIYKTYNINKSDYIIVFVLYMNYEDFKQFKISNEKKYIFIFDVIEEHYLQHILKFPYNTIIFYTSFFINNIVELNNIRLNYYGTKTEENFYLYNTIIKYGSIININDCKNILKNKKNISLKNLVFYKKSNCIYTFNNINFNFTSSDDFNSYVFKDDYIKYINNLFKIYKIDSYELINFIIYNYK